MYVNKKDATDKKRGPGELHNEDKKEEKDGMTLLFCSVCGRFIRSV